MKLLNALLCYLFNHGLFIKISYNELLVLNDALLNCDFLQGAV